jgi:hypothetical protein
MDVGSGGGRRRYLGNAMLALLSSVSGDSCGAGRLGVLLIEGAGVPKDVAMHDGHIQGDNSRLWPEPGSILPCQRIGLRAAETPYYRCLSHTSLALCCPVAKGQTRREFRSSNSYLDMSRLYQGVMGVCASAHRMCLKPSRGERP